MATWFEQNAVDLIGHGLTILGIIAAAAMVVWQLGRQHRSSLLLQRDNPREELKLRLHELPVQKIHKLSDANVSASMYAYMIPLFENLQMQIAHGLYASPPNQRAQEFSRLHSEASKALVELLKEFESWSIAFPGLEVFQTALNAAAHDAREAFTPLHTAFLRALPLDPPEDAPPHVPRPLVAPPLSDEEFAQLKTLVERYKRAMDDIDCYAHDLTIESQNNLLPGLFERRVPQRQPLDPSFKVISTDPAKVKELLRYFENETSWGKAKRAAEAYTRANLKKP